jgi:hypothetical protein
MNIGTVMPRILSLAVPVFILFCGCASPEAKQNAVGTELQTAGNRQVIVVPIFILSPPENGTPSNGGVIPPKPISLEQATGRWEPLPAKL